jgi:hypothetical protein
MRDHDQRTTPAGLDRPDGQRAEQPPAPPVEVGGLAVVRTRIGLSRRGWIIVAVVALLLTSYAADAIASIGRVRSGVVAESLAIGGKSESEAREQGRNVRVATVGRKGVLWKVTNWFLRESLLDPDHPEWERMWHSLYRLAGSFSDENPDNGERWQYTGTYTKRRLAIGAMLPLDLLVH